MADKKEKPAKEKKGKKEKSAGKWKLLILLLVVAGVAMPGLGLVVLAGMIPALVMAATDRTPAKSLTACVATLNAAGCLEPVIQLIRQQQIFSVEAAMSLLTKPETFLIMWGAAAIGFSLFTFIPPMIAGLLVSMAEMKIARLRNNQKELRRIWGDEVGG